MNKAKVLTFSFWLLSLGWLGQAGLAPLAAGDSQTYAPDRIIVKYKPGWSLGTAVSVVRNFRAIRASLVRVPPGQTAPGLVKKLSQDPRVEYAELDYTRTIFTVPNDPLFSNLWAMQNTGQTGGTPGADIDATAAWSFVTGSSNVVVAVIDTGVDYNHVDLAPNMWTNSGEIPNNGLDDDGNGYIDDYYGIDAITGSGDPMDDNATIYHGTHCSGTIGARGNNSIGVVGVNWTVKIMALKFLNSSGSGSTSDAITCIDYAIAKGANVMSNSWGGGGYDQSLKDAIDAAQAAGILFVAAAGNTSTGGVNTDIHPNYPSCYDSPNIISVAATDDTDSLASFSNYGPTTVDVAAPGVNIYSTQRGNNYQYLSGTSMATPHVAGLAALLKAYNSGWDWQAIKSRILAGTVGLGSLAGKIVTGGRINAYNSLFADVSVPHIYFLAPSSASVGSWIDINGYGFGETQGTGFVQFGGGSQAAVSTWIDSAIHCQVPSSALSGNVTVTNSSNQVSNGVNFTVTATLAVTAPASGTSWSRGYTHTITWSKSGTQSAYVKIQLYKGSTLVKTISLSAPNNGSFAWKIPNTQGVASNYRIRIRTSDGKLSSYSGSFSIIKPAISITAPTAGSVWTRGTPQTITWLKTGDQNANVSIQLFRGTTLVQTLAASTANGGVFGWTIPTTLNAASNYKVKIKTVDGLVKATSGLFTIN